MKNGYTAYDSAEKVAKELTTEFGKATGELGKDLQNLDVKNEEQVKTMAEKYNLKVTVNGKKLN